MGLWSKEFEPFIFAPFVQASKAFVPWFQRDLNNTTSSLTSWFYPFNIASRTSLVRFTTLNAKLLRPEVPTLFYCHRRARIPSRDYWCVRFDLVCR